MITEHSKFSSDKVPGKFFDTIQAAQEAEENAYVQEKVARFLLNETNLDVADSETVAAAICAKFKVEEK